MWNQSRGWARGSLGERAVPQGLDSTFILGPCQERWWGFLRVMLSGEDKTELRCVLQSVGRDPLKKKKAREVMLASSDSNMAWENIRKQGLDVSHHIPRWSLLAHQDWGGEKSSDGSMFKWHKRKLDGAGWRSQGCLQWLLKVWGPLELNLAQHSLGYKLLTAGCHMKLNNLHRTIFLFSDILPAGWGSSFSLFSQNLTAESFDGHSLNTSPQGVPRPSFLLAWTGPHQVQWLFMELCFWKNSFIYKTDTNGAALKKPGVIPRSPAWAHLMYKSPFFFSLGNIW